MNRLLQAGLLEEMPQGVNFSYVPISTSLQETEYKILRTVPEGLFVPCIKTSRNGQPQLYYLTKGLEALPFRMYNLSAEEIKDRLRDLFAHIAAVAGNGFLRLNALEAHREKIYVSPEDNHVRLTYVPVRDPVFESEEAFREALSAQLISMIKENQLLTKKEKTQLQAFLKKEPKLRMKGEGHFWGPDFTIETDSFLIGKNPQEVQGVIENDSSVSRRHCRILRYGIGACVQDLGSTNGTYLDGKRLMEGEVGVLKDGAQLQLGRHTFRVVME